MLAVADPRKGERGASAVASTYDAACRQRRHSGKNMLYDGKNGGIYALLFLKRHIFQVFEG